MPDSSPVEPAKQFLAHIHRRFDALRAADKLPASVAEWNDRKKQLRERLLESWGGFPREPCDLAPKKRGELQRDGYRVEKLIFQTRPGVWMTANAYVPAGEGKRPAVLCVHGHWSGAKQDPVPQSRCIGLAKLGFFVLAVDAFGAGERGIGKALGEYHGEMVGATLFPIGLPLSGIQVYENMRAVDYLLTRPEVDGTKLGITGASGGGNQTMYAGAFDERFSCVVPVCSVGTYRSYLGAACCMCEVVPDAMAYTEEWAVLSLVAPRALMVINATKDAFQFSVGEAQKSIASIQHVFRLFGVAGKIKHDIFESPHDYGKAMRESMYGWMTLHLKGQGQGNPIPEPELKTEAPEELRSFPGATRPDDWMTLPKFAAAEAKMIIDRLNGEKIQHREHWNSIAMTRQLVLEKVLGGFPMTNQPAATEKPSPGGRERTLTIETEEGIEITAVHQSGQGDKRRCAVVLDLDGIEHARETETAKALIAAGWDVAFADLRGTGRYAVSGDKIGRAPDHNSGEWSLWTGRPLLSQWVWDAIRLVDVLQSRDRIAAKNCSLFGIGPAGLVAILAAVYRNSIERVVTVGSLASFRTDVPYVNQRLGLFAPRILRDAGDVPHLAAMVAPRKLIVAGGVTGGGEPLSGEALGQQFSYTRNVYRVLGTDDNLAVTTGAIAESIKSL